MEQNSVWLCSSLCPQERIMYPALRGMNEWMNEYATRERTDCLPVISVSLGIHQPTVKLQSVISCLLSLLFIKWVSLSCWPSHYHSFSPLNLLQSFQTSFLLWISRTQMFWEICVWGMGRHHATHKLAIFQSHVCWAAARWQLGGCNLVPSFLLASGNTAAGR